MIHGSPEMEHVEPAPSSVTQKVAKPREAVRRIRNVNSFFNRARWTPKPKRFSVALITPTKKTVMRQWRPLQKKGALPLTADLVPRSSPVVARQKKVLPSSPHVARQKEVPLSMVAIAQENIAPVTTVVAQEKVASESTVVMTQEQTVAASTSDPMSHLSLPKRMLTTSPLNERPAIMLTSQEQAYIVALSSPQRGLPNKVDGPFVYQTGWIPLCTARREEASKTSTSDMNYSEASTWRTIWTDDIENDSL